MLAALIVVVVLIGVFWALSSPWRRSRAGVHEPENDRLRQARAEVLDLEAARDAKYREIRDTELDRQTGKLSDSDFNAVDAGLRAEAIEILRNLDRAEARLKKLEAAEAAKEAARAEPLERDEPGSASGSDGEPEALVDGPVSQADAE